MQNNPFVKSATIETRWLTAAALDDVMALQQVVCDELKRIGQAHFFVPLKREGRLELFEQGHHIAGLYVDGRLVAHMVFFDLAKQDLLKQRYHSLNMVQPRARVGDFYIISEMVAPDCRRNGYLTKLADWAMADLYFESAQVNPTIWATVSSLNMTGLHCNLKLGMHIQEEGLNLIDGTPLYLLRGELLPKLSTSEQAQAQASLQAA